MKSDREHKAQKLGTHIPGFIGYGSIHYIETDLQLRRFLADRIGEVRDRLADFIAAGSHPDELRQKLGFSLKTTAFLKEEIAPAAAGRRESLEPVQAMEERLLDFDLVLLDKVAALHSQIDRMEAAGEEEALFRALEIFDEGLAEVDDIFQERRRILQGSAPDDPLWKG